MQKPSSHISGEMGVMISSGPPYPPQLPALPRRYVQSPLRTDVAADLPRISPQKLPLLHRNLSVPTCKQQLKTLSHTSLIIQATFLPTMGLCFSLSS